MRFLNIDTSCDDTSVAITNDQLVESNVVSSQVRAHKKYGGVVPFLAQRLHKERIDAVIHMSLQRASKTWADIDAIAVTYGPGLAPALEVGLQKAKDLAAEHSLPLYAVNHMLGHIASCFAQIGKRTATPLFPFIALLVSGGHTELVYVENWTTTRLLGQKLDDALGEAYDKLAKMLGLGYPGGKLISQLAKKGNPEAYPLPIPLQYSKDLNFSYSGLKNACRLLIAELRSENEILSTQQLADIAASFEKVAQAAVMNKLRMALKEYPECSALALGGGVAANAALRQKVRSVCKEFGISLFLPQNLRLCTDNAAMIGVAAYFMSASGVASVESTTLDRNPGLSL